MRSASQTNAPLLLGAVGTAIVGFGGMQLLNNIASSTPRAAAAVVDGGTHAEIQPHSASVKPAGDHHIEAQLSKSGQLELYVYGQKERQLQPIDTNGLETAIEVRAIVSGESSIAIAVRPQPFPIDPPGTSSRFVGAFDRQPDQTQVGLSVTLPIDGRMYRVQWAPNDLLLGARATPQSGPAMPQSVSTSKAQTLFLTSGGRYTDADIAANGRQTATQKYGNQMSTHNAHPKPGDRLCPISETVASPKFSWVIGGKTYTFCCPPCIEEFVQKAKTAPQTIQAPERYVQPG